MRNRILTILALLTLTVPAHAIYFPAGIDWTNTSQQRFVLSMYLNILGRAPDAGELRSNTRILASNDNSQTRLDLFNKFINSSEYRQTFPDSAKSWRVYRAEDRNYTRGHWRYRAASAQPDDFERWELSGVSSESVAQAMATYYAAYCYRGIPCIPEPAVAANRHQPNFSLNAHACADESAQKAQFEWIAINGTTYPRGTDATTLCMGDHYYKAVGSVLQRHQCSAGYVNCQRDNTRDIRGDRTGLDANGNPTLFFANGSRLVLNNYDQLKASGLQSSQPAPQAPALRADQHACADPTKVTRYYQWEGPNGTTESVGVGTNTICMDNYYYTITGMTLKHHSCATGFSNCSPEPARDVTAQRRTRVNGDSALQFRNGTTLAILKKPVTHANTTAASGTTNLQSTTRSANSGARPAGQHACGDATQRLSQFRWSRSDGTTDWPDGVNETTVCMNNAYYEIDNFALRHHQCADNFMNCRASRGKDLIAIRDSKDNKGLRTLIFANGNRLSLVSR